MLSLRTMFESAAHHLSFVRFFSTASRSTTPLGQMLSTFDQNRVNLSTNPLNQGQWNSEALNTAMKIMRFSGVPSELILPEGSVLKEEKGWALQLLEILNEKRRPVVNYLFSSTKGKSPARLFIGNHDQGLKNLADRLKTEKIAGTILLGNIAINKLSTREALANVMSQPSIQFQKIDTRGTPIALTPDLLQSNETLNGLLKKRLDHTHL